MADYKLAVQKTLIHEGGYVNNPHDAGGETYRGVSRKNWPDWSGWDIIDSYKSHPSFPKVLNSDINLQSLIIEFYREGYWKNLYSQINDQSLAEKLFDMGVLFGVKTAVRLLQISMTNKIALVSDGLFGSNTLGAMNQTDDNLLQNYRTLLIQHVVNIVTHEPDNGVFADGWINRINS